MIADALKFFADLVARGNAPVKIEGDPRTLRYVIGGGIESIDVLEPPRDHRVGSLPEVIALAKRFADGGSVSAVWYDADSVVLVIDDDGHRVEKATLGLERSDVFKRAVELRDCKVWLDQKSFVRLLRIDLARCLDPVELLEKVRRVRFENGSATTGEVQRNRESLGREITSRVETGGEIPEEVTLMVPVYSTVGQTDRLPLRCAVEMDPARGAFQLLPLPDEIERVVQMAVNRIADELTEALPESVPAYYGRP